jgi:hypothetical protein
VPPSAGSWVATPKPAAVSIEVRLLGPLEVRAPGPTHGPYHTEAAALIALAAVLTAGAPASLVSELWPGPVAAAVAGRAREWLGSDASGAPRLAERNGAWRLAADVRVDWQLFRALVNAPGSIDEAERLATALALVRGELLAGVPLPPAARQALEPHLAEIRSVVVNAVHRDVALARIADDPARADWALRQGRMLLPREQALQQAGPG